MLTNTMLGILVAHHCNLSCKGCSNLSPKMEKYFVSPYRVEKDLSILGKFYHPKYVSLQGGEPLLHPNLLDVIDAVRNSGISKCVKVLTNGHLLNRMPKEFWQSIDEVHISLYPSPNLDVEKFKQCHQKAKDENVYIEIHYTHTFREKFTDLGTSDKQLIKRLYSTCQTAHVWQCHILFDGYFYKCPQSALIPRVFHSETEHHFARDGIKVSETYDFYNALKNYIDSEEPLHSCFHCLGTAGRFFNHTQYHNKNNEPLYTTEELINWKRLRKLEKSLSNPKSLQEISQIRSIGKRILDSLPPAIRISPLVRRIVSSIISRS